MKWKEWYSEAILFLLLLVSLPVEARLQGDSARTFSSAYEHRMALRAERWNKLIPRMSMLQYAGGFGTVSTGPGWSYARDHCLETHLLIGFIPKRYNRNFYWTLSFRELWMPWRLRTGKHDFEMRPLTLSLSLNSILHEDFWNSQPDRYPSGYYGISTRLRFMLGVGQRFSYNIPEKRRLWGRRISVYYEVSICDLYVRQAILNDGIPFRDLLTIGIGMIHTF